MKKRKNRLIAFALSAVMALSGIQTVPVQAESSVAEPGTVITVADPETLHRPIDIYGQNTLNAGKITVGKSVDTIGFENDTLDGVSMRGLTPDTNNFLVTLSQSAQITGLSSKIPVPIDAVFVLDTSGSMAKPDSDPRYENMISAANDAIASLMAANDQNRIAVVAFSSADYGKGTSNGAAANVLSELSHYDGEAATAHLQRVDEEGDVSEDGVYVAGRKSDTIKVMETERQLVDITNRWGQVIGQEWRDVEVEKDKSVNSFRKAQEGGTNIQAGIALGASLLMDSTKSTIATLENGEVVTRMPFIIVLSDGSPTFSSTATNWYDADAIADAGEQGPGSAAYAGNGFLAAMVAAYYKSAITERYYGTKASEENRCNIYTVGVDLESDMDADETALAEITLNPSEEYKSGNYWYGTIKSYWDNYAAGRNFNINVGRQYNRQYYDQNFNITEDSIKNSKNYVNGISSKETSMFAGGIMYNDDYFETTGDAAGLNKTFKELVRLIQIKAISLPTDTSVSVDFGGYVHFYDPIGEYMEVKDVHGIVADGYFFRGASFARNMVNYGTENADAAFDAAMTTALNGRLNLAGNGTLDADAIKNIAEQAKAADGQLYYKNSDDYNNSFCWWGKTYKDDHGDEYMQFLGFAEDDSIEYIEKAKAEETIPAGAETVCRSYYYYGTAGGAIEPIDDFLLMAIRVQRALTAPYQETVYVSIPGSLLSVDRVLITEDKTKSPVTYESFVQAENPVRIIYEVGLQSDINAQNVAQKLAGTAYVAEKTTDKSQGSKDNYEATEDTYYFYTNDWDRTKSVDSHERALAHAGFDVAADNDFYTFVEDTLLYTDSNGKTAATNVEPGKTYYYERTYYDWTGNRAKDTAGTLFDCTKKTEYIAVVAPDAAAIEKATIQKDGKYYVKAGNYTASSLSAENDDTVKDENKTDTSIVVAHPKRTNDLNDSHYTVYLGNNGRLALTADRIKTVDIHSISDPSMVLADGDGRPVTVGDELIYNIKVVNNEGVAANAVVTDSVPYGTELVAGSIVLDAKGTGATLSETPSVNNGKITWNIQNIPADGTVSVSFKVKVTEAALDQNVITIDNTATVKIGNNPAYETNKVENPPYGKLVEGADSSVNTENGIQVGQELRYTIEWANSADSNADITITDVVPAGTTVLTDRISDGGTYDASTNKITWELTNVEAGASGSVNFVVVVNESAKTPLTNGATIKIGENGPEYETNTTTTNVLTGDVKISKVVTGNGGNQDRYFSLTLTTRSAQSAADTALSGTFTVEGSSKVQNVTFTNGVAALEIKHGEIITIKGLPAGCEIHVEEAAAGGYTATYSAEDQKVKVVTGTTPELVTITNTYAVESTSFTLKGKKILNTVSGSLGNTTFSFDVYSSDETGAIIGGVVNTGQATVSTANNVATFEFAARTVSQAGTSYYLVKEQVTNINGVTYDTAQYLVKIEVADANDDGKLEVTQTVTKRDNENSSFAPVTLTDNVLVFSNSYEPNEVKLALTGTKELAGRTLQNGEFTFVVTENGTGVSTGIADANGNITFDAITYYVPGEHTYVVSEVNGGEANIRYDQTTYTVYVKVEDVGGQLTITQKTVNNDANGVIKFNNTYTPSEQYINLVGTKNLWQGDLADDTKTKIALTGGEFTFIVDQTDKDGNVVKAAVSTGQNDANGNIAFAPITVKAQDNLTSDYTETLYFNVSEAIPTVSKDPYMSYDTTVYKVQVEVSYDHGTGILTVGNVTVTNVPQGTVGMEFNNVKYPDSITVQPQGMKTTTAPGGTLPDDISFSFAVKNVDTGNTVYTGIAAYGKDNGNTKETNIEFSKLTYSNPTPGSVTYKYWIMESNAGNTQNGITYDTSRYLMTVTITNTDGRLSADVKYFGTNVAGSTDAADYTAPVSVPTFSNTYDAKGHLNITASKSFVDKDGNAIAMTDDQFAFRLQRMASLDLADTAVTGGVINGVSKVDGTIEFATLYYSSDDLPDAQESTVIRYKMTEIAPTINPLPGVTYDGNEYYVFVKLTHDETTSGVIVASLEKVCAADGSEITFEGTKTNVTFANKYVPVSGTSATITATKSLTGRDLQDGEFTFNLYYVDGETERLVDTTTNVGSNITFTRDYAATTTPGTYTYVIKELDSQKGGIEYDNAEYEVKVTITDENAELEAEVEYITTDGNAPTFTNTYTAQDVTFTPEAKKELDGRTLNSNEFSFRVVKEGTNDTVSIGYALADGTVVFTPITFVYDAAVQYPATHKYEVKEVQGSLGGVTYDATVYNLEVTVTHDSQGTMSATGKYYKDSSYSAESEISATEVVFKNTYATGNSTVQLEATKTLSGRDLAAYEFDFVVTDEAGNVIVTGDNDIAVGAGEASNVLFGTIGYKFSDLGGQTRKDFIYWMYEISPPGGKVSGITFDQNRYKVVVTVEDKGNGILDAAASYYSLKEGASQGSTNPDDYTTLLGEGTVPSFTNEYTPEPTTATVHAYKALTGKDLKDDEFTFALKDAAGKEITATNKNGVATFEPMIYTTIGTYEYTLTEKTTANAGAEGQYTYDESAYKVVVTVTDDGKGQLQAAVAYYLNGEPVVGASYTNSYTPAELKTDLSTAIGATKSVTDEDGKKVEITIGDSKVDYPLDGFSFVVKDALGNEVSRGSSDSDGQIAFSSFAFSQAGDYRYWISEENNGKAGITFDGQLWEVHIHVINNYATGKLEIASVNTYPVSRGTSTEKPAFVNIYIPGAVDLAVTADKVLNGRELKDGEFTFQLKEGNVIRAESRNNASGEISFNIAETVAGSHTYTIIEVVPIYKESGITYDETTVGTVTVTVVDDGSGQLKIDGNAAVTKDSGAVFTNTYKPAATTAVVTAKKILEGNTLTADAFTFELVDSNNKVVATAKNDANGNVKFAEMTIEKAGKSIYTIREQKGSDSTITYDGNAYKVTIEAIDNKAGNLYTVVSYDTADGMAPTFVNKYTEPTPTPTPTPTPEPTPEPTPGPEYKEYTFTKVWNDNNDAAGKRPDSIVLKAYQSGVYVTDIVLSKENGWTATEVLMCKNGDTEYEWTIKEANVPAGYSASYNQATLTVTNTYGNGGNLSDAPATGDNSNIALYGALVVLSLVSVVVLILRRKKEEEK